MLFPLTAVRHNHSGLTPLLNSWNPAGVSSTWMCKQKSCYSDWSKINNETQIIKFCSRLGHFRMQKGVKIQNQSSHCYVLCQPKEHHNFQQSQRFKCHLPALPGNMGSPQQNHKLHTQVDYEEGVILFSYTVLKPGAVMVIAPHTVLAQLAVLGSHGLLQNTIRKRKYPLTTVHGCPIPVW